ncbi:hypothetical protein BGZ72_010570 [Mortierella alpina]|nr:hypothetical protein BGZ72_010570 [Mortierella alpina]
MSRKDTRTSLWNQIVYETRVFTQLVVSKILNKRPDPVRRRDVPPSQCYQHASPHCHYQSFAPTQSNNQSRSPRHVFQIKRRDTAGMRHSHSCATVATMSSFASNMPLAEDFQDEAAQYESLWEVQLALKEIPGMIQGNILERCPSFSLRPHARLISVQHHAQRDHAQERHGHDTFVQQSLQGYISRCVSYTSFASNCSVSAAASSHEQHPERSLDSSCLNTPQDKHLTWSPACAREGHAFPFEFDLSPGHPFSLSRSPSSTSSTFSYAESYFSGSRSLRQVDVHSSDSSTISKRRAKAADASRNSNDSLHDRKDSGVFVLDDEEGIIKLVAQCDSNPELDPESPIMSDSPVDESKNVVVGGGNDLGNLRAQVEKDTETLQVSPGYPGSFSSLMATVASSMSAQ